MRCPRSRTRRKKILRTLLIAGTASLWLVTPIGCVIAGLMLVIAFSYRQTITAYPHGGGPTEVAGENIGVVRRPDRRGGPSARLRAHRRRVDCRGGRCADLGIPEWHGDSVGLSLRFLALLTIGNLRGLRESGRLFSAPTLSVPGRHGGAPPRGRLQGVDGRASSPFRHTRLRRFPGRRGRSRSSSFSGPLRTGARH